MKRLICCTAACLVLLTGCSGKTVHPVPPAVLTADGTSLTLPAGDAYPVSAEDIPEEAAAQIAAAAGCENTPEALGSIPFGENVFGIGLASVVYCGKYAADLSDAEWALLAEIAAKPEDYAPALTGGKTPSVLVSPHAQYASRIPGNAYFDAMIEEIITDMTEQQSCTREKAFRLLYSEGVTIETPFSPAVQEAVDAVYADDASFSDADAVFPQSACAVLDTEGNVLALGAGNHGNTAYNRAYRTLHPIGSSIKPLAVYTPAIQQRLIGFSSPVMDEAVINPGMAGEWPHNYNGIYEGSITVTYALRQSKNTVPVALCREMTPHACWEFMQDQLGFTTLTGADDSLSAMALGYLDQGVSMTELAAAYQIFGNGGEYHEPCFYTRVTDKGGKVLAQSHPETRRVLDTADAWVMNRLLYYNISMPNGIAASARLDGCEVCGKTGTVDNGANDTDRLFVGLTPDYTAAIWMGFDQRDSAIDLSSYHVPADVWRRIMERLPQTETAFTPDPSVQEAAYCTRTGLLAGEYCPETEIGYYRSDELPDPCDLHTTPQISNNPQ